MGTSLEVIRLSDSSSKNCATASHRDSSEHWSGQMVEVSCSDCSLFMMQIAAGLSSLSAGYVPEMKVD